MGNIQQLDAALWRWGRHGDTPGDAPGTVSQHLQGVSPTVIFFPWPIIEPGLWHIGRADGQEGHFSRSVKLEGTCRVLGKTAQACCPAGSQTQGEGRGQAGPQEDPEGSQHIRHM